jgi:hypothetical protein
VQHGALERDDPGTAGGEGHVRVDRIVGVEVDEVGLDPAHLLGFVERDQLRQFGLQFDEARMGLGDGVDEIGGGRGKAQQGRIVQTTGTRGSAGIAQDIELIDQRHGGLQRNRPTYAGWRGSDTVEGAGRREVAGV